MGNSVKAVEARLVSVVDFFKGLLRTLPGLAQSDALVQLDLGIVASNLREEVVASGESNGPVDEPKLSIG